MPAPFPVYIETSPGLHCACLQLEEEFVRANPEWVKELEIMVTTKVGAAGCAALRAVGCAAGCGVWALLCCRLWDVLCCGLWGVLLAQAWCGMCCGLCQGCAALSAVLQAVLWGEAVCCPVWPPTQSAAPSLPAPPLPAFPPACLPAGQG